MRLDGLTELIIKKMEYDEKFFDTLGSWIDAWWEERKKVIRLQHRLETSCLPCILAWPHMRDDLEGYLDMQADIRGFFSRMDMIVAWDKCVFVTGERGNGLSTMDFEINDEQEE